MLLTDLLHGNTQDPPQRREARFAKLRCALHPCGLLLGCL
ncbi:hypothetical protein ACUJFM_23085, partial [Escherichia coli]